MQAVCQEDAFMFTNELADQNGNKMQWNTACKSNNDLIYAGLPIPVEKARWGSVGEKISVAGHTASSVLKATF